MSTDATNEDVVNAAAPKVDQLTADDLIGGPRTFKVVGVRRGSKEQPINIDIEGHEGRPYRPCKGMIRIIIAAWTDDPMEWVGKQLTLYRNPEVRMSGVKVGGIEISHLSNIDNDIQFMRTVSRGVKKPFLVKRLEPAKQEPPELTDAEVVYVSDCTEEIAAAESLEALGMIVTGLAKKSDAVKNVLRPIYAARKAELTPPPETE